MGSVKRFSGFTGSPRMKKGSAFLMSLALLFLAGTHATHTTGAQLLRLLAKSPSGQGIKEVGGRLIGYMDDIQLLKAVDR